MNVGQLQSILAEYPPSMRLTVVVERQHLLETTVIEILCKLMEQPQNGLLTFFGRNAVILRERNDALNNPMGTLIIKKWLEMDMR